MAKHYRELIPNADVVELEGIDHCLQALASKEALSACFEFRERSDLRTWRIKALAAPKSVLTPDVILSNNSDMRASSPSATHKRRYLDHELSGVRHGHADL
jgi:hypothetical protein